MIIKMFDNIKRYITLVKNRRNPEKKNWGTTETSKKKTRCFRNCVNIGANKIVNHSIMCLHNMSVTLFEKFLLRSLRKYFTCVCFLLIQNMTPTKSVDSNLKLLMNPTLGKINLQNDLRFGKIF